MLRASNGQNPYARWKSSYLQDLKKLLFGKSHNCNRILVLLAIRLKPCLTEALNFAAAATPGYSHLSIWGYPIISFWAYSVFKQSKGSGAILVFLSFFPFLLNKRKCEKGKSRDMWECLKE